MKKIKIHTVCSKMLADIFTPVGIYLRLRDKFRDTVLLESTDFHAMENSFSFICINAIGGIEIRSDSEMEYKLPLGKPEKKQFKNEDAASLLWDFMQKFEVSETQTIQAKAAQGLFGYCTYDAVRFFESIEIKNKTDQWKIPLMRYRLYQYVIAINHFRDELYLCENKIEGLDGEPELVESLIRGKDVPVYPFKAEGPETSNLKNEDYLEMVKKGIASCKRGDVFQIVLSRRFYQKFTGDEFNVYRALRSINPSPYLFYFDYTDYKLMGSSPESQLVVKNGKAVVHPIAGTFKRTGDEQTDREAAERLLADAKENAEHVMLVDLARNDLSRVCDDVSVTHYREIQYFSHVIHLVSEVTGRPKPGSNPFELLGKTFPAGTLSGAPKYRAMELIDELEPDNRNYYGGTIGFMGFDGSCNHTIMIRSFLSKQNTMICQAGAGIVAASKPESELEEVNNKLGALRKALVEAELIVAKS